MSLQTDLAQRALREFVLNGRTLETPDGLPPELAERRAGSFVSLHVDGELRGCIGTITPAQNCVAAEIIHNAIAAGTQDPRFPGVRAEDLDTLEYNVDVLEPAEPITDKSQLDVRRYGVIVSHGWKRGLLLPDLDGVDSVDQQVAIALRKAGIRPDEPYQLQRFKVLRYGEGEGD